MPIALSQISTPHTATGTTVSTTFPSPVTTGNGVVVVVQYNGNFLSGAADSLGNSYTLGPIGNFFNSLLTAILYLPQVPSGGSGVSVVASFSSSVTATITAFEVIGQVALNTSNHNSGNSTAPTAAPINTSVADTIVIAGVNPGMTGGAPSPSFNEVINGSGAEVAYRVFTSTQTGLNPTWSNSSSSPFAAAVAAFTSTNTTGIVNASISDHLNWSDVYGPDKSDLLHWLDIFTTAPPVTASTSLADTFTLADVFKSEDGWNDTLSWSASAFVVQESFGRAQDELFWLESYGVDVNLLATSRFRR